MLYQNYNLYLPSGPPIPSMSPYPGGLEAEQRCETHTPVHGSSIFSSQDMKAMFMLTDEWMNGSDLIIHNKLLYTMK